ncbi:MAG: hypothetical protein FJ100_01780 [Deltaproteobacteria bacterium]|nr:hypothetical protein [Deltaproteobacteria bacterium]
MADPPPDLTARPQRLDAALPWLAGVPLCALALQPISDSDVPMHAAVGRWMLRQGAILPTPDPLVWTDRGGDAPHEWLAQGVLGAVADAAGLGALRMVLLALAVGCLLLLARSLRRAGAGPAATAALLVGWTAAVAPHLAMRPHVFGWWAALAVLGLGLADPRPWSLRCAVGWGVATALWANLHSSAVAAPLYAALAWVDAAWHARADLRGAWWRQPTLRWIAVAAGALCQPLGPGIVPYVLRSQAINGPLSDEWQGLLRADVLRDHPQVVAVWAAAAVAVAMALRTPRLSFPGVVAAAFALAHAAWTRRMTVFLFVPALLAGRRWGQWLGWRPLAWVAVAMAWAAWVPDAVQRAWSLPAIDGRVFPVKAAAFLHQTGLRGRLFNPDPWGGYLSWQLAPQYQVFLDGRWLLAGEQVVRDGLAMQIRRPGVDALFERYGIEVFLQRTADYVQVPPPDPTRFALAWRDGQAVVLVRKGPNWMDNVAKVCAFYRSFAWLAPHGRWAGSLRGAAGQPSPTDVPEVMAGCGP